MSHHYFASTVFGWATAPSREEAITKAVRYATDEAKRITSNAHKEGRHGMYIWSCMVHAPADAQYQINYYQPQGVKISEGQEHAVTYITRKELAFTRIYDQEYRNLKAQLEQGEAA